jgi:hypothetical protein
MLLPTGDDVEKDVANGDHLNLRAISHICAPSTSQATYRFRYATAITAALVATLFEQQFSLVVLNVFEDNSTAIRIYQRLGFQTYHQLLTGKATRSL